MAARKLELTPEEIAEAQGGIRAEEQTATQIQALTRAMDTSKTKWKRLRQQGKMAEYRAAIKKENEILFFNYPSLFELHLNDRLDGTFFEMLQMKRKVEKGEMTMKEATETVGKNLYNRFVPHVISNTEPPAPTMRYEDFYKSQE